MIFDIVKTIHAEGVTVLLVEQNAKAALEIADYGYVLETGRITFHGPGKDLLQDDRVRRAYLGEAHG
jgi:branched-chain amino acid transport system ATP-binding protein